MMLVGYVSVMTFVWYIMMHIDLVQAVFMFHSLILLICLFEDVLYGITDSLL